MKRLITYSCMAIFAMGSMAQNQKDEAQMNRFISGLMKKMTLEEKVGQLSQCSGGFATGPDNTRISRTEDISKGLIGSLLNVSGAANTRKYQEAAMKSRLQIPLLFGLDVIHGYRTGFPLPLAEAASFDLDAIERGSRCAAKEAAAAGLHWTFAPMVDISWDARWGRVMEGAGEDPYYGSLVAKARVHGLQGDDLSKENTILSCIKHFAGYGAAIAGKDYNSVDMSMGQFVNFYMPPYKAGAEAGAATFMSAFNDFNNEPSTGSTFLLRELLKNQWGFKGFVVSDWGSVGEMMNHRYAKDEKEAAYKGIKAGLDMEMVSECYSKSLVSLVKEGKVSIKLVDDAVRRILEQKYKLGLFDDPYKYCDPKRPARDIFTRSHRDAARRIASESFVLLKNDNQTLPLKATGTIAVIGPLADTRTNMPGTWSVAAVLDRSPSLIEGLREMVGRMDEMPLNQPNEPWYIPLMENGADINLLYAKGSNLISDAAYEERATMFGRSLNRDNRTDAELLKEAIATANKADVIVAALGESSEMSGESSSRTNLDLPDVQQTLLKALVATGKPVVLVLFTGRPLVLNWEQANVPAILNVWFGGSEAAYAIGDVLFGRVNPSGKLTMSFPQNVGQIPLYYAHKNTGRPLHDGKWFEKFRSNYLDVTNEPLYPFGFGLSYTTFAYSDISLSQTSMNMQGVLTASVNVTNTGAFPGGEVVQLYIRDLVGSTTRPVKELKGFERIYLQPGQTRTVTFKIAPEMLKFYNYDLQYVVEPGDFSIMIGPNSRDVQTASIRVEN